jgi:hypothetical protein
MPAALVTGLRHHLAPAAAALARTGFSVTAWESSACEPPPGGPFDCYVQLPCAAVDELTCRVDTLAAVAAYLRPDASVLLGVEDADATADRRRGRLAPDLAVAMALALLEELGRPAARVGVLPLAALCRPAPAFTRIDPVVGATQWEIPTPPLVSAP